ncbi:MAG: C26 family cysteine hydrolase domain-containing family [Oscillatoriales cyanobacterium SM2_2_1]|nr:C26 family cysteine hydrolase domain-containing family [Oscillatoriales cyanobacterium SM2_2_1]
MLKVHYLQHVPFEGLGSIESWMTGQNHTLSGTRLYKNEPLPNVADLDWLIILGGPMNIYEDQIYPWLIQEKKLIEQAIKENKTILGICLGSQLIADVLGAKVYSGQHKEIGWYPIKKTNPAPIFDTLPPQCTVFHWHGDTFDLPDGAIHLAYTEACQNQAFIYQDHVLALQFHLESTRESVQQIIANCANELVAGTYIQKPEDLLAEDQQFATINAAMNQILHHLSQRN